MRIVFLGPPGVGKGTLALQIEKKLGAVHISTGDMLRAHVESGSILGKQAKEFIDRGELVPDNLIIELVRAKIMQPDCLKGFILDGFPRTLRQAEALDEMLGECDMQLIAAVSLTVGEEELVRRLGGRRNCSGCGATYHNLLNPPKVENECSYCGHALKIREDDKPDAIRRRLQLYREKTEPLITYYKNKSILVEIDAAPTPEKVFNSLLEALPKEP